MLMTVNYRINIDFNWINPKLMDINEKYLIEIDFIKNNPKLMDVNENDFLD